ncbi:unnamed protein product [Arctogadus glacialis]
MDHPGRAQHSLRRHLVAIMELAKEWTTLRVEVAEKSTPDQSAAALGFRSFCVNPQICGVNLQVFLCKPPGRRPGSRNAAAGLLVRRQLRGARLAQWREAAVLFFDLLYKSLPSVSEAAECIKLA